MNFSEGSAGPESAEEVFADRFKDTYSFGGKGAADRTFSRVDVSFPCRFLVLSEKEFNALLPVYMADPTHLRLKGPPDPQEPQEQGDSGSMAEAIMERLDRIEKKIDRLLGVPALSSGGLGASAMETGHVRDISGAGILMSSPLMFGLGACLNIEIDIREPYPLKIAVLGRVVRLLPPGPDMLNLSACEFTGIHGEDRKEVNLFVQRRHREMARIRQID